MIKKLLAAFKEFFKDRGHQKFCSCGKYEGQMCPNAFYITGAGVLSIKSNDLVKCGKFQEQARLASQIAKLNKARRNKE